MASASTIYLAIYGDLITGRVTKNQAFEDAYRKFYQSLSLKDQPLYSPCASEEHFLESMKKLELIAKQRRRQASSKLLDRIAAFSARLQPFFDVVGIMIQSNPEYSALVWSALRFVLQVYSSLPGPDGRNAKWIGLPATLQVFFEKLLATLEQFSKEMPQYQDIELSYDQHISTRLKEHTEKLYSCMFQFFKEIARIFTSSSKIKRTPAVIGDLLWRPFEDRFKNLLEQMQIHRRLIEFDLYLGQARAINDINTIMTKELEIANKEREEAGKARRKIEEAARMTEEILRVTSQQSRDHLFDRIQRWLSPPQFSEAQYHGQQVREDGTTMWIFTNPQFREWAEGVWSVKRSAHPKKKMGGNVLWVNGNIRRYHLEKHPS